MRSRALLTGSRARHIHHTILRLITRNYDLSKLARSTDDPNKLREIIQRQADNNQAVMIILALLLAKQEKEADDTAARYLSNLRPRE